MRDDSKCNVCTQTKVVFQRGKGKLLGEKKKERKEKLFFRTCVKNLIDETKIINLFLLFSKTSVEYFRNIIILLTKMETFLYFQWS